jgi:hypothetical protein
MAPRMSFAIASVVFLLALLTRPVSAAEPDPVAEPAPPPATQPVPEQEPRPSVELLSVQITRAMSSELTRALFGARGAAGWRGEGTPGGVELVFAVQLPGRAILHVYPALAEADPFEVTTFTDDKETDLGRRPKEPRRPSGSSYSSVTLDGKAIVVAVSSARPPGEGARKVLLRGSLMVRTNPGDKTSDRKPLALRGGRTVDIDGIPLGVRKLLRSKDGVQLTLSAAESLERIKSVRFFTLEGEEIPARMLGRAENRPPHHSEIGYQLPPGVLEVEVEATYMSAIETVIVPVEVEAKLMTDADEAMVKLSDE